MTHYLRLCVTLRTLERRPARGADLGLLLWLAEQLEADLEYGKEFNVKRRFIEAAVVKARSVVRSARKELG